MMRLLTGAVIAVGLLLGGQTAQAAGDPVTCQGYPEPRIFLENQSWWSPQPADPSRPSHPGTGETGHIHVGTCFPAYQSLAGDFLHLDVNVKFHNITGATGNLRVYGYGDATIQDEFNGTRPFNLGKCDTSDCEQNISVDFALKDATYKGWHEFHIFFNVTNSDGSVQRNITRYYANIDRPSLPNPPVGSTVEVTTRALRNGVGSSWTGGDSWYFPVIGGSTGKYARANILRESIPWNEATGDFIPLSGTWTPTVQFEARTNFVYIDPALHANPPNHGTVVYEQTTVNTGYHTQQLSIDTTQLTNGLHKLLIATGNVATNGTHSGILVVPFFVENGC